MKDTLSIFVQDSLVLPNVTSGSEITLFIKSVSEINYFDFISNDTLFTIIITSSIFILGYFFKWLSKFVDNYHYKNRLKKYFTQRVDTVIKKRLPVLSNGFSSYFKAVNINSGIPITPPLQLVGDYERLSNIDLEKYLSVYNHNHSVSKLVSGTDFIVKLLKVSDSFHNRALNESNIIRNDLALLLDNYLDKLAEYLDYEKENLPLYENDKIWILINDALKLANSPDYIGKRVLSKIIIKIIRPIQRNLVDSNYYRTKPLAKEITTLGKSISNKYYRLEILTVEVKRQYKSFYLNINSILAQMTPEYEINKKSNTFWKTVF